MNNCLLVGNTAVTGGGQIGGGLTHCTIVSNTADTGGGCLGVSLRNSIIYYNTASITNDNHDGNPIYCCSPVPGGFGRVTNAPMFRDPGSTNYRLFANSPCIDAGDNNYLVSPDLDGVVRPLDGDNVGPSTVDMGCYEHLFVSPPILTCPFDSAVACGPPPSTNLTGVASGTPTATNDCATNIVISYLDTFAGGDCTGVILRVWTATDDCGNMVICTQTLPVVDNVPPSITCSSDINATNYFGAEGAFVIYSVTNSDACDPAPVLTCSHNPGDFFLFGTTTVVCVSVDACSNSISCSNTITVVELPFLDTDLDNIDDNWEILVFTNLTTAGVGTDFDMDGQNDEEEYLLGTDAMDPDDNLEVGIDGDTGEATLSWQTKPGKTYNIQFRPDLLSGSWSNIAINVLGGSYLDSDPSRTALPSRYYRIAVP